PVAREPAPSPPPAAPQPRREPPSQPSRPDLSLPEPEAPAAQAPAPAPPPPRQEAIAVDGEIATGLRLAFDVQPDDTFVSLREPQERRFRSIGQARDFPAGSKKAAPFQLPGPGEYYLRFYKDGMQERVYRVRAGGSAETTRVPVRMARQDASTVARGDLPRYRVAEAVAVDVEPREAARTGWVLVDGQRRGGVDDFSGGLGGKRWLELPPGRYRVSVEAPGFRRHDFLVEVLPGAESRREKVAVRLVPEG
ncbi:MAG TPA: hypothetical protein VMT16_09060, partial [Thermoanaerobaculia bacterium]|nr:hypothetical protein [Thermoanaerobaculia bacterium]